jgi:hypothetical protein
MNASRQNYQTPTSTGEPYYVLRSSKFRSNAQLPVSELYGSRAKIIFLILMVTGAAVIVSALTMAFTIDPKVTLDLYVMESTILSLGIVMLCMGIILMKNGEEIFGTSITERERQRMHDEMHDQVMSEMRLSPKDLEIQRSVQESNDELFK